MSSELLTIAEYSKRRGCSVSAVYKRLKSPSNRIHNYVVKEAGQTFLKAEILSAEEIEPLAAPDRPPRSDLQAEQINRSNTTPKPGEEVENPVEEGIGVLAIKVLEQQLAEKDKQIEDLNRQLNEAAKHEREMTDRLAALLEQANELQRNNQILLAQTQQIKQIEAPQEQPDPAPEKPKKSRWHRFWFGD